ncbi:BLUF domain-containing protein [Aquabacterium sp.]|uniref:BLUF domain-containing protein n=1 Tax=Aquabacterium sp. TaxID=1872578 RepID=UPI0025C405D4|nr:BLUF domain-containing protein [Aquabacterium sp.]
MWCRTREACGVTGVLLHQGGNFFQYLEGPEEGVAQVYARVKKATSHHGLIELLNGPVEQRHFTAWTMGFAEAARSDLQRIAHASWATELGRISSAANAANPGLVLLLDFWHRGT